MDPQWIIAGAAAVTLLITWTTTMIGGALWIVGKINKMKDAILDDIRKKHEENRIRIDAMQTLLIRHDTLLDPEYSNGKGRSAGRQ